MKAVTRRNSHQSWVLYVVIPGFLSWLGFLWAHLHPALALVPIIPFMPVRLRVILIALDSGYGPSVRRTRWISKHLTLRKHARMTRLAGSTATDRHERHVQ